MIFLLDLLFSLSFGVIFTNDDSDFLICEWFFGLWFVGGSVDGDSFVANGSCGGGVVVCVWFLTLLRMVVVVAKNQV